MPLPDYHEAYRQAEAVEAEYDRKCEAFPHCDLCGSSLYPYDTYTELDGRLCCEKCVEKNTYPVDRLVVLQ